MELLTILRHDTPPRTEYCVELPTDYGKLRLDVFGPIEAIMRDPRINQREIEAANEKLAQALNLYNSGDVAGSKDLLMQAAKELPVVTTPYSGLFDIYTNSGDLTEALYWQKQVVALQPNYTMLLFLARTLARLARYDEAVPLHEHLWQRRHEAAADDAQLATRDYLITLGRVDNPAKMLEVATAASADYGPDPTLEYQRTLALTLLRRIPEARANLARVIPQLAPDSPMLAQFEKMRDFLDRNYPYQK